MKINVDAVVFPDKHSIGTGCVARDHAGTFIDVKLSRLVGVDDAVLAEALGMQEVLSWIKDMNWLKVVMKSDALTVAS